MHCALVLQFAGAVRAAGSLDADLALAEGAHLGGGFRGSFFLLLQVLGLVGSLHDDEEHQGGKQEFNNHSREGDQRSGPGGSAVFDLGQALNNRVQEDFHNRGNNLAKGAAQDNGDSQVDNIAFERKCFKLV